MSYKKVCLAAASLALPLLSAGAGVAMPSAATGMRAAVEGIDTVESVQYVLGGRRYCWSNRGWHGPGWYRCGMELSYGYGWGGPSGWHGWREGRGEFRTGRGDFRREGRGDFRREGGDFRRDGDARGRTSSGGGSTRGTSGVGQGEPRAGTSGSGGAGVRSGGGGDGNTGASGGVGGAGGAGGGGSPAGGGAPAATPGQRQ